MNIRAFNLIAGLVIIEKDEELGCIDSVDHDANTERVLVRTYRDGELEWEVYNYCELVNVQGVFNQEPKEFFRGNNDDMGREVTDRN